MTEKEAQFIQVLEECSFTTSFLYLAEIKVVSLSQEHPLPSCINMNRNAFSTDAYVLDSDGWLDVLNTKIAEHATILKFRK